MGTYWYNSIEKSLIHHINVKHPDTGFIEYRLVRYKNDYDAYQYLQKKYPAIYSLNMECKAYHDIWALTLSLLEIENKI